VVGPQAAEPRGPPATVPRSGSDSCSEVWRHADLGWRELSVGRCTVLGKIFRGSLGTAMQWQPIRPLVTRGLPCRCGLSRSRVRFPVGPALSAQSGQGFRALLSERSVLRCLHPRTGPPRASFVVPMRAGSYRCIRLPVRLVDRLSPPFVVAALVFGVLRLTRIDPVRRLLVAPG
jgi:hypothetical protein